MQKSSKADSLESKQLNSATGIRKVDESFYLSYPGPMILLCMQQKCKKNHSICKTVYIVAVRGLCTDKCFSLVSDVGYSGMASSLNSRAVSLWLLRTRVKLEVFLNRVMNICLCRMQWQMQYRFTMSLSVRVYVNIRSPMGRGTAQRGVDTPYRAHTPIISCFTLTETIWVTNSVRKITQ